MRRKSAHYSFMDIQATLYRLGPEAFFTMIAETLTRELDARGAQRPYEFHCSRLRCDGLDGFEVLASEITPQP